MAKGTKSVPQGGQRRTIECACGYRAQGHPTQINLRMRLHDKVCGAAGIDTVGTIPAFNYYQAYGNGWGGCSNGKQHNMIGSVFSDKAVVGTVELNSVCEPVNNKKIE
jgi:hypothetical protein